MRFFQVLIVIIIVFILAVVGVGIFYNPQRPAPVYVGKYEIKEAAGRAFLLNTADGTAYQFITSQNNPNGEWVISNLR